MRSGVVIDYGICIAEIGRGLYDLALRDGKALLRALQMIAHQAAGDGQRGRQHGERNDAAFLGTRFRCISAWLLIIHNASPFLHIVFRLRHNTASGRTIKIAQLSAFCNKIPENGNFPAGIPAKNDTQPQKCGKVVPICGTTYVTIDYTRA